MLYLVIYQFIFFFSYLYIICNNVLHNFSCKHIPTGVKVSREDERIPTD